MTSLLGYRKLLRKGVAVFIAFCAFGLLYAGARTPAPGSTTGLNHDVVESLVHALSEKHALSPQQAEQLFLSVPNPESAKKVSRAWTAKPHYAGSANDYDSALELLSVFQRHFGINPPNRSLVFEAGSPESRQATLSISNLSEPTAWIDTYYPLLDRPGERKLEILNDDGSVLWSAYLEEKFEEGDPAGQWHDYLGAWHALSRGGDVRGKLIDAGYGRKWEFDALVEAGHNLTGVIALVRSGGVFRGLKVKAAQEAGAVGCIIYSDPSWHAATIENGHKPWPEGPGFSSNTIERGSVQFLSMYPGDPTTPGTPSYRNANRTKPLSVPDIPSLPISYTNGKVLLEQFEAGSAFSKREVRLLNTVHDSITPIWNTMAVIPGHIKDEIVMIGNHRDAWVLGAGDPTSGTVAIHEIVKGLGALVKQGWRPLRTIMFASWDAEEYGIIGSTEWGEDFPDFIQEHVVAYINVDSSAFGERFTLRGSPSLANFLRQAAEELPHPTDPNRTLWDARHDTGPFYPNSTNQSINTTPEKQKKPIREVGLLGSGSDYTVFLQRFGIASMDESFRSGYNSAVWPRHSVWDSELWMETYGDPGFHRHVAVARHMGLVLLRLANQAMLPMNTTHYSLDLNLYLDGITRNAYTPDLTGLAHAIEKLQAASKALDRRKDKAEARLQLALDRMAKKTSTKQYMYNCNNFTKCRSWSHLKGWYPRVLLLQNSCANRDVCYELVDALSDIKAINKVLSTFEQGFISEKGIPDREWYRHLGVAPGRWKGYGATTFPALSEAVVLDKDSTLAAHEAQRLVRLLEKLAERLV